MFFKQLPHKKRVWLTTDCGGGWIHSERPQAYKRDFWKYVDGQFTSLGDRALKMLGLSDIKPNELIEIEITITKRTMLEKETHRKKGRNWIKNFAFGKSR